MTNHINESVKDYYSNVLKSKDDLKTSACCPIDALPTYLQPLLRQVHDDIQNKFYGCGSPIPYSIEEKTILDLGCGTGRDVYLLSQLVGESGHVIGVDMTQSQLDVANAHCEYHMTKFGYKTPNVSFHQSYIEDLSSIVADNSVDVVISNCVINLSPHKEAVFKEIFRVLKPGGELLFSDVFAGRRIPASLKEDPILLGEGLGGALYIEDFRRILRNLGCFDYRVLSTGLLELHDYTIKEKAGMIDFYSMTVRTFKCDFEDICENYGHVAWYQGTISYCPHSFRLDDHHEFKTGLPVPVCGNTAKMLSETHYASHFKVVGNFDTHYGVFDCLDSGLGTKDQNGGCC